MHTAQQLMLWQIQHCASTICPAPHMCTCSLRHQGIHNSCMLQYLRLASDCWWQYYNILTSTGLTHTIWCSMFLPSRHLVCTPTHSVNAPTHRNKKIHNSCMLCNSGPVLSWRWPPPDGQLLQPENQVLEGHRPMVDVRPEVLQALQHFPKGCLCLIAGACALSRCHHLWALQCSQADMVG